MALRVERLNLPSSPAAGDTITSSVSTEQFFATQLVVRGGVLTSGSALIYKATGILSTPVVTVNALTLRLYFGSVLMGTSGSLQVATLLTNALWNIECDMDIISGTTTATMEAQSVGMISVSGGLGLFGAGNATTVTGPNITVDQVIKLSVQFSGVNVGTVNTIQLRQQRLLVPRF